MSPPFRRPSSIGCTCLDPLECPARGTYRYCPRTLKARERKYGKPQKKKPGRVKRKQRAQQRARNARR